MKKNYQKILEIKLEELSKKKIKPSLLLHSCCAPCSSYVLEYLSKYFQITVFYYNPNIDIKEEYKKRFLEQKRFINEINEKLENKVKLVEGEYDVENFHFLTKGLQDVKEGGARCFKCYELRLLNAAIKAKELNSDYFTTVLSISPHKNSKMLNEIGRDIEQRYKINFLESDFKKNNGYKRSIELSKEYNLYRQDYCGCSFSKAARSKENEQ
jgi:predicted adenine nucleotide alpha hydrolase (AANH) superfamily ATPase